MSLHSGCCVNASAGNTEEASSEQGVHRPFPFWRVWQCVDRLQNEDNPQNSTGMMRDPYRSTTIQVCKILELWGHQWAGDPRWKSLLNKKTIRHEAEESIVALHHLKEWMASSQSKNDNQQQVIAVDVCGGKGFFSMLLSYMASEFWQSTSTMATTRRKAIQKIILLEKASASEINWRHIQEANARQQSSRGGTIPVIEIWSSTNLHKYDELLTKFQTECSAANDTVLALTGIHLCKMLSPSFVSLANGLGPRTCPYLCLSPCCMPRTVTSSSEGSSRSIPIHMQETHQERQDRLMHNELKFASKRGRVCFLCSSNKHWVRKCPRMLPLNRKEQDEIVVKAAAVTPCWSCGVAGHTKPECPNNHGKMLTKYPPTVEMDVSDLRNNERCYEIYCEKLASHIQTQTHSDENESEFSLRQVNVLDAGLTNGDHQEKGWNSRRKSIYIVAAR